MPTLRAIADESAAWIDVCYSCATRDFTSPEIGYGGAEILLRTLVGDYDVGELAFFVGGPLGGFAAVEIGFGPSSGAGPLQTQLPWRIDHQHHFAHGPPAGFEEERCVEDDGGFSRSLGFVAFLNQSLADAWVEQIFEEFAVGDAGFRLGEDATRKGGAVDGAIGRQNRFAPAAKQSLADVGVIDEDGMASAVGIQEDGAELDEHFRGERFAAGDAADKADGFHATFFRYSGRLGLATGSLPTHITI